jgi:dipeptidyl aminopeptidase/acylaminoacyl peptidase
MEIPSQEKRENFLSKSKLWLTVGSLLVVLGIIAIAFYVRGPVAQTDTQVVTTQISPTLTQSPTPTPFPFQEITIPYLRTGNYQSSLGKLEKIGETSTYTSYLTSFTSEGLRINGLLTEPKGLKPESGWPGVVFVHGYIPPQQYNTRTQYSSHVDYLARNGLAVFKIDLRGHGNSEGDAGGSYYSGDYIIDVLNAREALKTTAFINPDKIGLWGHSMAGNVTFRAFTVDQNIPALVIWAGAVYSYEDFRQFGIDDNSYQPPPQNSERQRKRDELFATYGQFDPESAFWKQVPATNYLEGVTGNVQLNHATNDNVVSIDYSRNLARLLQPTLIKVELNEYSSGGHNLSGDAFNQAMQKTTAFFKTHLN